MTTLKQTLNHFFGAEARKDMAKHAKAPIAVFIAVMLLSLIGCGGAKDGGNSNDITCYPPFTLINGSCDCPSGSHKVGSSCESDTHPDTTPPSLAINSPVDYSTMDTSNVVTVNFTASDASGISETVLYVDGSVYSTNPIGTAPNFQFTWNGTSAATGSHTLKVSVRDNSPNANLSEATVHVTKPVPPVDPCAPWRSQFDPRRPVRNVPSNYGPRNGYLHLYVENGECWIKCKDENDLTLVSYSRFSDFVYTAPVTVDGYWTMPYTYMPGSSHGYFMALE